jgi:hypothetical protein
VHWLNAIEQCNVKLFHFKELQLWLAEARVHHYYRTGSFTEALYTQFECTPPFTLEQHGYVMSGTYTESDNKLSDFLPVMPSTYVTEVFLRC